jgi:small GTP-binding protein
MNAPAPSSDHYRQAMTALERTLDKVDKCSDEEKQKLHKELAGLTEMRQKLHEGQVEIVIFGEISTGKSALINALLGQQLAAVDVRGGWTKEVWKVDWSGCGYCVPGLADSRVVLIDTPGVNEVGGGVRGEMAREAAQRADLILFVTDSDLNDVEHSALVTLASLSKPIIVVLNKIDLYSRDQRTQLMSVLRDDRLRNLIPAEQIVTAAADPREREYIIQSADGKERSEWRKPEPDVADLKARILEVLDREGLSLLAINAALYAADKSDRIAALKIEMRNRRAEQVIWSYAGVKAIAVGLNPLPYADILGGTAADAALVVSLGAIYGLEISWKHAGELAISILKATGWNAAGVAATLYAASTLKALSFGKLTPFMAVPQGAAAGYGSYIVGQAARYYFEHGSSWGGESAKEVVQEILATADQKSVMQHLKDEIRKKMLFNPHAAK